MTQAHKTPGALVEIHDDLKAGGLAHDIYSWLNLEGRVFEVIKEDPYNHIHVKDIVTGELIRGCHHDDNFQTISKELKRKILKDRKNS